MYHFDGSHKVGKTINLSGQKGTTGRNELLKSAYRERLERERERAKNTAARKILQAWTRYQAVYSIKKELRRELGMILESGVVSDWLRVARMAVVSFDPRSLEAFQQLVSIVTLLDSVDQQGVRNFVVLFAESAASQSWLVLICRIIENSVRSVHFPKE